MKNLLTLSFCLILSCSFSQNNFRNGAIIKMNGDTLNGLISDIFDSKSVQFRENKKLSTLNPGQIKGFIFEGNTYLSKYININEYEINEFLAQTLKASEGPFLQKRGDINSTKDSVFLHLMIKGRINLYEYISRTNIHSYFGENDTKIIELPPPLFTIKNDSTQRKIIIGSGLGLNIKYTKKLLYVDSLKSLMTSSIDHDYYNLLINNSAISYNLKSLMRLVLEYNSKFHQNTNMIAFKRNNKKIYVGFLMGTVFPNKNIGGGLFVLIPSYGTNKNLSYRLGYQSFGYRVNSATVGLRYSSARGPVRPYGGASLTMIVPYTLFPVLIEYGATIPIKRTAVFLQGNIYPPFGPKRFGFQVFSYSLGFMF